MSRITNEKLVLEAIRRSKTTVTKSDGSVGVYCRPSSVFHRLQGWLGHEEKLTTFGSLLDQKKIAISCNRYKREASQSKKPSIETRSGSIESLHPDMQKQRAMLKFCTSTRGRLLPLKYGVLPSDLPQFYYEYNWNHIFVRADGLPGDFPLESLQIW